MRKERSILSVNLLIDDDNQFTLALIYNFFTLLKVPLASLTYPNDNIHIHYIQFIDIREGLPLQLWTLSAHNMQ